jgi:hypothetical protein
LPAACGAVASILSEVFTQLRPNIEYGMQCEDQSVDGLGLNLQFFFLDFFSYNNLLIGFFFDAFQ